MVNASAVNQPWPRFQDKSIGVKFVLASSGEIDVTAKGGLSGANKLGLIKALHDAHAVSGAKESPARHIQKIETVAECRGAGDASDVLIAFAIVSVQASGVQSEAAVEAWRW
jgi:hypothetical protein